MVTYDSGADGHYTSKDDQAKAGLPILHQSKQWVGVANDDVSHGKHVTQLPIPNLPAPATEADTFDDFRHSLLSVGKTCNAGTVSLFTKDEVTVHREEDILIACKGKPILVGTRDTNERCRMPLAQQRRQWQPQPPTNHANVPSDRPTVCMIYQLPNKPSNGCM